MAPRDEPLIRLPLSQLHGGDAFAFSWPAPEARDRLAESVARHGVLRPPLVAASEGGFRLLDGARRLDAARRVGIAQVWARRVDEEEPRAVWNRLLIEREGSFNIVEKGLYLERRLGATGEALSSLPPGVWEALALSPRAADEALWIARLPARHRDRFAAGELPAQGLKPLLAAPGDDALAVLDLTEGFRLGVNKFPETARLFFECAWREGLSVGAWAEREGLARDCPDADALRERLWALRNPTLAAWTRDFAARARACPLPEGAQLAHAKGFEGGRLRLTLAFGSVEELRRQAAAVARAAEEGALAPLEEFLS